MLASLLLLLPLVLCLASIEFQCPEEYSGVCELNLEAMWARDVSPHSFTPEALPVYPSLPRIHVSDLSKPENSLFKSRRLPFILTGALDSFPALQKWKSGPDSPLGSEMAYLTSFFPNAVSDFYPGNLLNKNGHPHLIRSARGYSELFNPTSVFDSARSKSQYSCDAGCQYIHTQILPDVWNHMLESEDIPKKRHKHLDDGNWWMRRCLTDNDILDEFHIKTHQKMIISGTKGAGMFNHSDSVMPGAWHAHLQGRKWWYLCESPSFPLGDFLPQTKHTRAYDHQTPMCYESVVEEGELLYYGFDMFHETRNLESPTTTMVQGALHRETYIPMAERLQTECVSGKFRLGLSGALCDALDKCYEVWDDFLGVAGKPKRWSAWRSLASTEEQAIKDARKATENNYDGRNFIFENIM